MSEPVRDARTTPPWLQVPGLLLVVAMAAYFLSAFHFAMGESMERWLAYGTWQMFTVTIRSGHTIHGEMERDGVVEPIDLPALYPYRWETGPRYGKMTHEPERLKIFAKSVCYRLQQSGVEPDKVRLYAIRTDIRPYKQPQLVQRRVELQERSCRTP
jgi:hypothetical protein